MSCQSGRVRAADQSANGGAQSGWLRESNLSHVARLLTSVATTAPISAVLAEVARLVEADAPGLLCSVMLVDAQASALRLAAAPTLPAPIATAFETVPIGEGHGCCGTAAARREMVAVDDVRQSAMWIEHAGMVARFGLCACWSMPFLDPAGAVAGTLAVYARERRSPGAGEIAALRSAALLAGLVVARHRDTERLRASVDNYRHLAELAPDAVFVHRDGVLLFANPAGWHLLGLASAPPERPFAFDAVLPADVAVTLEGLSNGISAVRWERADGSAAEIEVRATAVQIDGRDAKLLVCRDLSQRLKLEREILHIAESERARMSADLHDSVGQQLTGVSLYLASLIRRMNATDDRLRDDLSEISGMLARAIGQVRSIASTSFPVEVRQNGLAPALLELARRADEAGPACVSFVSAVESDPDLDSTTATQVYRIAQEALNNALRHAMATRVELRLAADRDDLVLSISDDGRGMPTPDPVGAGIGIRGMRYRAALIRARLAIRERTPRGLTVEVRVQLNCRVGASTSGSDSPM